MKTIEYIYYIELENNNSFGIGYKNKDQAIKIFMDNLENERVLGEKGSQHWKEHYKKYVEMIKNNQVKIIEIKREIKETRTKEILK